MRKKLSNSNPMYCWKEEPINQSPPTYIPIQTPNNPKA